METDAPQEPPNPPSAAQNSRARQGSGRTPKLRASCDNCSNAKVRCDQDRPACQRCLYVNIQCNYSASRRMGKPPVSAKSGNEKSKATTSARRNSKADAYSADTTSECSESPKNTTQPLPDTRLNSYGQDFDYAAASQPWNEADFMPDRSGAQGSFITDLLDDSLSFNNFSNPQANASNLTQPQMATAQMQPNLSTSDQLSFSAPFQNNAGPSSSCIRVGASQSAFQMPPDLLASSNTISDQHHSITHQSTSCLDLASSTLHSLSMPSSLCTSSATAIPLNFIEQVLATSRGAISAFHTLLQCPCSHSSSFALTLALMISKILGCYSAICRCSTSAFSPTSSNLLGTSSSSTSSGQGGNATSRAIPSSSSSSTSLANSSTPGSSTSGPRGPHNMVLDTPITIGTYKIDADDEHVLLLQLVLSELRKVGKLVDAFAGQYSALSSNSCGVGLGSDDIRGKSIGGEETMYKSLEQFLRYQVYQARIEVSTMLREGEEGV